MIASQKKTYQGASQTKKAASTFKRPKRCFVCAKMISANLYDAHFQQCCNSQKEKVDRERVTIRQSRPKVQRTSIKQMLHKNPSVIRHNNVFSQAVNKTGINFRIKNHPSQYMTPGKNPKQRQTDQETHSRVIQSESSGNKPNCFDSELKNQISQKCERHSEKTKVSSQTVGHSKNQKLAKQENQHKQYHNLGTGQIQQQNPEEKADKPVRTSTEHGHEQGQKLVTNENTEQLVSTVVSSTQVLAVEESQSCSGSETGALEDPVAPNHTFRIRDAASESENEDEHPVPRPVQINGRAEEERRADSQSTFEQMSRLTQEIIGFINRVGLSADPTLAMMVEQLHHVNEISHQIQELNQVGNSLGFTMESLFGNRIQELQSVIITQVSFAVLRSFSGERSLEFQILMNRNPELRRGFTKSEIEEKFPARQSSKEGQCSICLEEYRAGTPVAQMQCSHQFHRECIEQWLDTSKLCPMCRKEQN